MNQTFSNRIDQLRRRLKSDDLPGLLVTNPVNVTYLTGFTGDSSNLLVTRSKVVIISDSRFASQLSEECAGLPAEIRDATSTTLVLTCKTIQSLKLKGIGIESGSMTKAAYDELSAAIPAVELIDTTGVVETLRAIKDRGEIDAIRRSIRVNERAFEVIRARLTGDQTEKQIAHNIEHQMRAFGASQCAFKPIVGVGSRSALPHATVTDRRVSESPFVLIDWGAQVDLYVSDLTRVLITGKAPAKFRKIYDVVLAAQQAAINVIRAGVTWKEVDRAARGTIERAGYGKYFGHGLGHGFGLQVHELPFLSPIRDGVLSANMVVTVEPGIYLPDFGGVRIEDDVLVTESGYEVLSKLPKTFDEMAVDLK